MRITRLTCRGFRCLRDVVFEPQPGLNVIRGQNAQGKTSVLEAILYACTSKSHRTNTDADLVAYDTPGFHIVLTIEKKDRGVQLEAACARGEKRFKVNGVAQSKVSDILGKAQIVFFSPEDIAVVKGGASARRKFLDMELSQLSPPYLRALQQYRQVLRQRNEALRRSSSKRDPIEPWDDQLAQHGAVLMQHRDEFVKQLAAHARTAYGDIAPGETLDVTYAPNVALDADFKSVLAGSLATDMKRGATTHGPHLDDIDIRIHGHAARSQASQGQQKSAALSLRLAEIALIRERVGEYPILMLDEVMAELDERRATQLFKSLPEEIQCISTTTVLNPKAWALNLPVADFSIEEGQLAPSEAASHG